MGLIVLIVGLAIFHASHLFVRRREARAGAIARLGMTGYRIAFSIVSIAGLAMIVWGFGQYRAHGMITVWSPPDFLRHVTVLLMLFASIFIVAAFIPSHITVRLKHPMLAAVKTWALAHLLINGDLGSILLFGSFLAWGVIARIAAKKAGEAGAVAAPPGYVNDILVVVIGLALYLGLGFYFHPYLIGVPVFTR
ncbi:MAG: NnrU family protein [Proteobacteria bacterium]|nr:NnrU family protein [Pseudomonadota bacterium]